MPGLEVLGRETEIVGCLSAFQHNLFKVYVSCIGKTKPVRLAESHAPPRSSAPRTLRCTPSRPGGRRRTARRTPPLTDACDLRRQIRPKKRRVTSIRHTAPRKGRSVPYLRDERRRRSGPRCLWPAGRRTSAALWRPRGSRPGA